MRIYTKTGDDGTTSLFGGRRVPKSDPVVMACGTIDELSSYIGLILSYHTTPVDRQLLKSIQIDLYEIMAVISEAENTSLRKKLQKKITMIEKIIDSISSSLPSLTRFIIPGGTRISSLFHVLRTLCRRAERILVIHQKTHLSILSYMNRLSDLFFVLARKYNTKEEST